MTQPSDPNDIDLIDSDLFSEYNEGEEEIVGIDLDIEPAQSLLDNAHRRFLRVSEAGKCWLRIGFSMLTEGSGQGTIAMRMGNALEPMIVDWLTDHGMPSRWTGENQIEVEGTVTIFADLPTEGLEEGVEPLPIDEIQFIGHPDGILMGDAYEENTWTANNIPQSIRDKLNEGMDVLSEIKTMNTATWRRFRNVGLIEGGGFLTQYHRQIQLYMHLLRHGEREEYREIDMCLVTGFCPDTRRFAFDVVRYDAAFCEAIINELYTQVILPMKQGQLPPPKHDLANDPECGFCTITQYCPAMISNKLSSFVDIDSISTDAPDFTPFDLDRINEIAAEYANAKDDEDIAKAIRIEARDKLIDLLGEIDEKVDAPEYGVKVSSGQGRLTIDMERLKDLAEDLGFKIPMRRGPGGKRIRVTSKYGPNVNR